MRPANPAPLFNFRADTFSLNQGVPIVGDPRIYKYAPQSALALGKGFSPNDLQDFKPHFLQFTPTRLDSGSGVRSVSAYYCNSYFGFAAALQYDVKAEASFLGASGGAETSIGIESEYSESSITIVLNGTADFGRWSVGPSYKLRDEAAALASTDPAGFLSRFGTRFVESERRGAKVNVVLQLESVNSRLKTALKASAKAGANFGEIGGGSAQSSLSVEIALAAKQSRLRISVFAAGANTSGMKDMLANLAKESSDPLTAMSSAVSGLLAALNPEDGIPIEYYVATMDSIGVDPNAADLWTDVQEGKLVRLVRAFRSMQLQISLADQILDPSSTLGIVKRHKIVGEKIMVEHLTFWRNVGIDYLDRIAEAHKYQKQGRDAPDSLFDRAPKIFSQDEINELTRPPRREYWIAQFTDAQVRQVLAAPYNARLDAAKAIDPSTTGLSITCGLRGLGLSSAANRYFYDDGDVKTSEFQSISGGGAGLFFHTPPAPWETAQDEILKWATAHAGSFKVSICDVVRDIAGREFVIPWIYVDFTSDGTTLQRMDMSVIMM